MVIKKMDLRDIVLSDEIEQYLKAKTPSTATTYRGCLKRFRKFYGKSITEFLKAVEDQRIKNKDLPPSERRRFFEETINDFINHMQELGYANNPIRGSLTALQNLFKYYDVPISYNFVKMPPPISKKSNGKHRWKIPEMKKFVDGAKTYRDKAIIMTMFQTGMAVGEICSLNYGDVSNGLESGKLPLLVHIVREKNSNEFKTLLGADAVKYLKLYLGTRTNLKRKSPLFAKEGTEKRVTPGAIQNKIRDLADEIFGGVYTGEMNPYRPHSLRSAFRSRLTGKTSDVLIKYWMGDALGPKAGAYLNLPDEEHMELYSKLEHRLSIETTSIDSEKKGGSEVQDIYLRRLSEVEQDNTSLKRMVNSLSESNEKQERLLQMVMDRLVTLEGLDDEVKTIPKDAKPITAEEKETMRKATEQLK